MPPTYRIVPSPLILILLHTETLKEAMFVYIASVYVAQCCAITIILKGCTAIDKASKVICLSMG